MTPEPWRTDPPHPEGARSVAELGMRLRALRAWAGVSVREIHRRVVQQRQLRGVPELPALDTVHRCIQPGRIRLDQDLVTDIARALLGDDVLAEEWRQAHRAVTDRGAGAAAVSVRQGVPDPVSGFVGRRAELASLLRDGTGAAVVVLYGMAGVGKTTLARHVAQQLVAQGRFADLQLSVNLRSNDLERPPADPAVVLDAMLRELGCSAHEIYGLDLPGRMVRFRTQLAGKQALILLDDAATAEQVAPLLPGNQACLALVTSRRTLPELAARHTSVEPFTPAESRELLASVVGAARLAGEPEAAAGIAEAVGHLPLALALVAGKIRKTRGWTLQDHLTRLTERCTRLSIDKVVTLAIESSYVLLPESQQRLLRLLAVQPGRNVDGYAAAALAGMDRSAVANDLSALADENLLVRRANGRFELHDLIRLFAADRAGDLDAPRARTEALTRLGDYYRYAAYQAARLHEPYYVRTMRLPRPVTALPSLTDRQEATAWLGSERLNLIAYATHSADHGRPEHTSDLASLLHHYLYSSGHLYDAEQLERLAIRVTRGVSQARARGRLGSICSWIGNVSEAREHNERALAELEVDGDRDLRARCLANHGIVHRRLGRFEEAISYHREARALFLDCGEASLAAQQLGQLGHLLVLTGQHTAGFRSLQQALTVARQTSDYTGEADALGNLGHAALAAGAPHEAFYHHNQALRIFTELGDRAGEVAARNGCGSSLTASGEPERALEQHCLALAIAEEIGDREGEVEALVEGGHALRGQSKLEDATDRYTRGLRLAQKTGNAWQVARAHDGVASAHAAMGDRELAREHWRCALALHATMGTVEVDRIAAKLAGVEKATPAS